VRIRESSCDYQQYGPYLLVDAVLNAVVADRLDLLDLAREIDAR
jgi:hypothetical protein